MASSERWGWLEEAEQAAHDLIAQRYEEGRAALTSQEEESGRTVSGGEAAPSDSQDTATAAT